MAEQNSYDFWTRYSNLCLKCKVCPLKSVIKHMRGTTLCCPVERIRSEHWQFLLSALSVDNSLTEVYFKSDLPSLEEQEELWKKRRRKKDESYPCPYGYSPHNISDICKYSAHLLIVSQTLQTLIIENLPITKDDALHLAEGLKSTLLKEFAMRCYPYSDEVIEIVCQGLWDSNIFSLDFSTCNLSAEGLKSVQNVILKHKARRTIQEFPDTLRFRLPIFEEMMGLTRIILNGNNIGDKGVEMICEAVSDDRWIQALDLQYCGITNVGANAILEQITANHAMQLVDLRLNKIDGPIIDRISLQLGVNSFGKIIKYTHLPLWKPRSFSKAIPVRKNKLKTKVTQKYYGPKKVSRKETKNLEHAFRISCEIIDNKESTTKDAITQTNVMDDIKHLKDRNKSLELTVLKEMSSKDSLTELSEKFKSENLKLLHLNENLRMENMNLRKEIITRSSSDSAILIDKETYSEIKHVFEKFHRFLKLMKDNGLWDLVTTIGVDEYENTKLETVPSESKVYFTEKEDSHHPGCSTSGPVPRQQKRHCTCHNPGCISHKKTLKENNAFSEKLKLTVKVTEEKVHEPKVCLVKEKVNQVIKDMRETYRNRELERQGLPPSKSVNKHSREDRQADLKSAPSTRSLQCPLSKNIFNKFKQFKNRQDLFEAVKKELEKTDCDCQIHKATRSLKSSQSVKNQANVNNKNYFKNVSSQTAAIESIFKSDCQKTNSKTLSEKISSGVSQESGDRSSSQSSTLKSSPSAESIKQTLNIISRNPSLIVTKIFPNSNVELQGMAAGAEGSNSILSNPDYFKTSAASVDHVPLDVVPDFSKVPQGTPKSTSSKSANSMSITFVGSHTSEQKSKVNSNLTSYSVKNSNKSYLESVSDASTDKDVKSLSGSEIYESVKSDSVHSKSSSKSKAAQKAVGESISNPGATNSVQLSSSSKSSKRSQKQKRNSNHNASGDKKTMKKNSSSSSVPSLSDITTVSSHSLNTNSVMDQLSENEKGLS